VLINNKFFYVHIPRTGGRYITFLFKNNKYKCKFFQFNNYLQDPLKKLIEIPHLEYPYYEPLYNFKNVHKFTVVRDPLDRFISMLSCLNLKENEINTIFKNYDNFNEFVNIKITNNKSNWFVPQVKFIGYETKIWKFEDSLDQNFEKWLKNMYSFNFKNHKFEYHRLDYDHNTKIVLNKKQKSYIKKYYYQDYKILY